MKDLSSPDYIKQLPAPPRLIFDDGSRIMQHEAGTGRVKTEEQQPNPRGGVNLRDFYEIDRLVQEIQNIVVASSSSGWTYRVALQFPDEQLADAPAVCWEFEAAFQTSATLALIFVLGDTTYAPCCPDTVAAAHLQANVLIHYGRNACLSATTTDTYSSMAILYSFGNKPNMDMIQQCQEDVLEQVKLKSVRRLLLLYEVQYHSCIEDLQSAICEQGDVLVVAGQIPVTAAAAAPTTISQPVAACQQSACCDRQNKKQMERDCCDTALNDDCCSSSQTTRDIYCCDTKAAADTHVKLPTEHASKADKEYSSVVVGGLELPVEIMSGGWSSDRGAGYTVLFIGHDGSRQFLNIVLRFLSSVTNRPDNFWTWSPETRLCTDSLSPTFQRILNRRFYLVQKAKQCRVFGILVAHLTEHTRKLVASLHRVIQDHNEDLASYTFVVGKINPAKLANFPEIDCFVLVACPEHSLLSNERELYHIPIITPGELLIAFGVTHWGLDAYSTHPSDYWTTVANMVQSAKNVDDDDDSDAPYFSLVTGKFESSSSSEHTRNKNCDLHLEALPGRGVLTTYASAAADFLSQREYQGLVVATDEETVQAAIPGQTGIASNYGDR